tara:strand:+ start:2115 stop:2375 length:261 start_codon:yes stop_codon:yes gene_type:complete
MSETKENIVTLDGEDFQESEFTSEQLEAKTHIQTLQKRIADYEYEINELLPSLRYYKAKLISSLKATSQDILKNDPEIKEVQGEKK